MYYILAIDQIINTWNSHQYSDEQVQKVIDDIMSDLSAGGESIIQNIEKIRMVVEIVSDIQIFGSDVHLTEKQVKKIRKVVNQALKQEEITESVSVVSLKLIDSILKLSMVDDALVKDAYDKLKTENGVRQHVSDDYEADIYATYMFLKLSEGVIGNIDEDEFTAYNGKFVTEKNLYSYRNGDEYSVDAASIFFGYYIDNRTHSEHMFKE